MLTRLFGYVCLMLSSGSSIGSSNIVDSAMLDLCDHSEFEDSKLTTYCETNNVFYDF